MIEEINNIFRDVQDLEIVLTNYNKAKTDLKNCESEINKLEVELNNQTKINLKDKIVNLENEHKIVLSEIKKIDLCTKECYKLSEIKAMFEFIHDNEILSTKCINFLNSLMYNIYISKDEFVKNFTPQNYRETNLNHEMYKIVKFSNDLNEFFNVLKDGDKTAIYNKCYFNLKMILEDDLDRILPNEIFIYYDLAHFYLIYGTDDTFDLNESQYYASMSYANKDYLYGKKNILPIFYEIFKDNLVSRLLENELSDEDICETNEFIKDTEYFITNINEWKLDCVMKEVITISKSKKSNQIVQTSESKILPFLNGIEPRFIPDNISHELYRFLLCMNVFNNIESKRSGKAIKIMERALYKMMNNEDLFVSFADITLCLRIFSNLSVNVQLSNLREQCYNEITRKSTDLTKNLQDSLLILKVYFKGKHFDFVESVKKFVPRNSQLAFEIAFFNLLYTNVIENILCMKFLTNDKISDLSELLKYLLDMSYNIQKGCIDVYLKFKSVCTIFDNDLDETIAQHKIGKIYISNSELKILVTLLYKDSKTRNIFINTLM